MKEIDKKHCLLFKVKEVWFADDVFDVNGYSCVVFRGCEKKIDISGFQCYESATLVIDLTQTLDKIWDNFGRSSCKYCIKKAIKDGIEVRMNERYKEFCVMNKTFRKSKKLTTSLVHSPMFFEKNGVLFIAELHDEMLGGSFFIEDESRIRWIVGASKRLSVSTGKAGLIGCANRLILWEAIKYAKNKGLKEFDFGGYPISPNVSDDVSKVNAFKKSWGGNLTLQYNYVKNYSLFYRIYKKIYMMIVG